MVMSEAISVRLLRPATTRLFAAVGGVALIAAGCDGSKPNVPFGTVHGRVMLDGAALPMAAVMFEPETGRPSYGTTNESGEYALLYRGKPWGAIVGKHRVRITTEGLLEDDPGGTPKVRKEVLPKKYHVETTLTADVARGDNTIDFELSSK